MEKKIKRKIFPRMRVRTGRRYTCKMTRLMVLRNSMVFGSLPIFQVNLNVNQNDPRRF